MIWAPVTGLVLAMAALVLGPCPCGHVSPEVLMISVPAAALAWWGFLRDRYRRFAWRVFLILVVIGATYVLARNVADVLRW